MNATRVSGLSVLWNAPLWIVEYPAQSLCPTLYHYTASFTGNYTEKSIFSIHSVKHTV